MTEVYQWAKINGQWEVVCLITGARLNWMLRVGSREHYGSEIVQEWGYEINPPVDIKEG